MYAGESGPRILVIDAHGQPVRWAGMMRAARYYASGKVLTDLGESLFSWTGGTQERTGRRSEFIASSIVMIRGRHRIPTGHAHVGLTKQRLFARDRNICGYCGQQGAESELTVEHIQPVSRGGRHEWTNVVTACRSCNTRKGNRQPEEARPRVARLRAGGDGADLAEAETGVHQRVDRDGVLVEARGRADRVR